MSYITVPAFLRAVTNLTGFNVSHHERMLSSHRTEATGQPLKNHQKPSDPCFAFSFRMTRANYQACYIFTTILVPLKLIPQHVVLPTRLSHVYGKCPSHFGHVKAETLSLSQSKYSQILMKKTCTVFKPTLQYHPVIFRAASRAAPS